MGEKERKIVYAVFVALFVIFMAAITWYIGLPMVRFAEKPEDFRQWVDSFGVWGRLIFLGIVVFQVIVAFVPGEPIELAAGYVFGFAEGSILTLAGFLIGSWFVYSLVRRYGVKLVEVFFSKEKIHEVSFLKNPKKTRVLAFVLMTIPGTPKDFLSYFAGLTPITLKEWLVIVAVSRIPSLITSTLSGAAAGERNYILSAVMLGITLLVSAVGIGYYRRICAQERVETEIIE